VHGAGEARAADDQRPRNDPGADNLVRVVDVIDERVERSNPLGQTALDRRPLSGREHARDEIQRPRTIAPLAV
jgi:hypothetical protein